ncbi:MAG: DEAD/DEAH box helicase [Chloroflexi bacterium]|nr:DEAD/DEAH box helicase [Chloroflexota bacterium]
MSVSAALEALRQNTDFMRCVTSWQRLPARSARLAGWPAALDPRLVTAAHHLGVPALYSHQVEVIEAALSRANVIMATGTASGKTLAYNLPVLHTMLNDPNACALYIFPTKALAHDQMAQLGGVVELLDVPITVSDYDGDTASARRADIRRRARLLVTNPDMLHTGILPYHTRWARFMANLRVIVLDELHTYRGVFGCHVANVLRRLRRICQFYGADPRFICSSATIANAQELGGALLEAPVTVVDEDGSPRGEKHFILYNPPLVDRQLGIRQSSMLVAKDVAAHFLKQQVQTIVFARARLTTEILLSYLRDQVMLDGGDPGAIHGYRGGYLPGERRSIEQGLREGEVRGVVATNALELGVDIGQLGACVMAGYPGTIASAWQQAGRAGRRSGVSVAVLIGSAFPLDQYLITHPDYFFGQSVERALLDPDNPAIVARHLACAAFELPFEVGEPYGRLGDVSEPLSLLVEEGVVHRGRDAYTWIGEGYPAGNLSLRTSVPDAVVILDIGVEPAQAIGQMDRPSVPSLLHTGAVYLHAGQPYLVEALDWEQGIARVRAAELDYYTRASGSTEVEVIETYASQHRVGAQDGGNRQRQQSPGGTIRCFGEVLVTNRISGYRKVKRYSHETLAQVPLDLPPQELRTIAYWVAISEELAMRLQEEGVLTLALDYGPSWPAQRDAARARDSFRCRQCGVPESSGRQHDVHHITPFRTFGYVVGVNEMHKVANQLENLITLCWSCHHRLERVRRARGALSGMAYLLQNLAPLYLMCDPGDLGSAVQARAPETGLPTVTLYDQARGGTGLTARLYELHDELLCAALDVVADCPCTDGCPACIGPTMDETVGSKELTRRLLQSVVAG